MRFRALVLVCATACVHSEEPLPCGQSLLLRTWTGESDVRYGGFGASVTSGDFDGDGFDDVVVGASSDLVGIRVYRGSRKGVSRTATTTWEGDVSAVVAAGDGNRDGFGDLLIASDSTGVVELHLGSASGPSATAAWSALHPISYDAGIDVASGDLDGDGFDDVVVGAALEGEGGTVTVYFGSATGPGDADSRSGEPGTRFGASVAVADVDDDGFEDVLVGSPFFDGEGHNEGRVRLFRGSRSGLATDAHWSLEWHDPQSFLGTAVANAGDVNGDGFDDVLVGSVEDEGFLFETRLGLVLGAEHGLEPEEVWNLRTDESYPFERPSFVGVGDVDADGFDDVVVAGTLPDEAGTVALFRGSSSGLGDLPSWTDTPELGQVYAGGAVSRAGDVDADGFDDVIVGAPEDENDHLEEGRAFVYRGGCVAETP